MSQRFARDAGRRLFAVGSRPNHVLHLILTIITFGWWAIVWIILALKRGSLTVSVLNVECSCEHGHSTTRDFQGSWLSWPRVCD